MNKLAGERTHSFQMTLFVLCDKPVFLLILICVVGLWIADMTEPPLVAPLFVLFWNASSF